MRKLAAELGISATTIYWHVGGRDDVVAALIERQSERLSDAAVTGTNPRERVASAARNVWTTALAHPNVTRLAYETGYSAKLELPLEISLARELVAAGLDPTRTRDALRGILYSIGGFLVMALRPPDAVPADRTSTALWGSVDDPAIPARTRDRITEPPDLDQLFERTMSALIDSILAR